MTKCTTTPDSSNKANNSKRKGTRSVSTLTPSQLARKRANDREAQRAIRARTKEHIESLERQVEDLRGHQGRDRVVQELLRRNKALEDELRRLRENLGLPTGNNNGGQNGGSLYQSAYPGATCTRTPPLYPTAAPDYQQVMQQQQHDGPPTYNHIHDTTSEAWHQASMQSSIGSTVSSPSSRGTTDDFGSHNFITAPATMPPNVLGRASIPPAMDSVMSSPAPSSIGMKAGGGAFEDIKPGNTTMTAEIPHHFTLTTHDANGRADFGNVMPMTPTSFHAAQQPWNMYPMYYTGSPATAAM
ncbi:hypothetical protein SLS62_003236 [Diatrype stigma]|uniref:BZIP transcription factor n=1 Tax=Diatrype stigma TaxID=117547 RepID=A0AAN9V534_9PEZI